MGKNKLDAGTVRDLFEKNGNISIKIPEYQRAYSWEEKQCKQFLDDLLEQKGKAYYLGQFLFEEDAKNENVIYIIDGQQRLTTIVIFFSAVASVIKENEDIKTVYLNNKFRTTDIDNNMLDNIKIGSIPGKGNTFSQKRMKNSFEYFKKELTKYDESKIFSLVESLEYAKINIYIVNDKIESVQIFEYQNDRGKALTRFEILKSFLMLQIYIENDSNKANEYIKEIQEIVKSIYTNLEGLYSYFSENKLLDITCYLHYKRAGNVEEIKYHLEDKNNDKTAKVKDKTEWILSFFKNFLNITESAKSIHNEIINKHVANLFLFGDVVDWKIVLISLFRNGVRSGKLFDDILKLLEILSFKVHFGDFRADYLDSYSYDYFKSKDENNLYTRIYTAAEKGFKNWWKLENIIENTYLSSKSHYSEFRYNTKYVLWQYENKLRECKGANILTSIEEFKEYTIEHIQPQNPDNKNTVGFEKDYLHVLGNLSLLTHSQNSRFNNKPFEKKKKLYEDTALISYADIRKNNKWTEEEITERTKKISDFVKEYFKLPE